MTLAARKILEALLSGEILTDRDALQRFGVDSIHPAVGRLRKRGLPIVSRPRNANALDGTRSWLRPRPRYHEYRIPPEQIAEALARLFHVGESPANDLYPL